MCAEIYFGSRSAPVKQLKQLLSTVYFPSDAGHGDTVTYRYIHVYIQLYCCGKRCHKQTGPVQWYMRVHVCLRSFIGQLYRRINLKSIHLNENNQEIEFCLLKALISPVSLSLSRSKQCNNNKNMHTHKYAHAQSCTTWYISIYLCIICTHTCTRAVLHHRLYISYGARSHKHLYII